MYKYTLFEFMKSVSNDYYELAVQIESQLYEHPETTLIKIRLYFEQLVKRISEQEGIEEVYPLKNSERIHKLYRQNAMEEEIYLKLEWVRKKGNKAAHNINTVDIQEALKAHRFLFDVSVWYMQVYISYDFETPIYRLPRKVFNQTAIDSKDVDNLIKPYIDQALSKIDNIRAEMNQELERLKKEKEQEQTSDNTKPEKASQKPFPIIDYLGKAELNYIDKRDKKGALWVLGDWSLNEKLMPLKKHKIYFRFTKKGGRATNYEPAWFLLNKNLPLLAEFDETTNGKDTDVMSEINRSVVQNNESHKEQNNPPILLEKVSSNYWAEKGQILRPQHLVQKSMNDSQLKGIIFLQEGLGLHYYGEITEEILRDVYKQSLSLFYQVMEDLYLLGFRFTDKLSSLQLGPTIMNDIQIIVANNVQETLDQLFPYHSIQRLKMFQINSVNVLDKMLISSIAWLLREDYEQIFTLFKERGAKKENESENLLQLVQENSFINDEVSQSLNENSISKSSSSKEDSDVLLEPRKVPIINDDKDEQITLNFKEQNLSINIGLAGQAITTLNIEGCNHLIRSLNQIGIKTLNDLSRQLFGLHEQLIGVGPKAVEKFWNQLVELGETRENRIYSENELEHVIVYQDKEVIVPQEIFHMEFGQEDFFGNMKTIEEMRNYGYRTFGELPIDFQQLEQLKGVGTVKVEQIFATLETVVESMLEDNKLNQMADDERLTYKLNQFVNWYHDVSNLDQPLISQRISAKYFKFVKKRYSAYLNGNHLTLEQLGNKEGVTRERIRQILKKGDGQLIEKWRKIHSLLQNKLRENGGIILAECLNKESEAFFMLLHAFETEGIYFDVINHTAILTVKDKHELESYVETIQQEVQRAFSLHVITNEELKTYSKERSIVDHVNVKIIFEIALDAVNWLSDDQGVLKNMTKSDAVEMVMLQYPNGVEVYKREDELINKANDLMPNSFHGERSFNAIIGREDNQDRFALWGRGEYIHRKFITHDKEWIHTVQDIAASWIEEEEYIHVAKLYKEVKDEAEKRNVPNEYALYTLMRQYDKGLLAFPRFPAILPYGSDRIENHEWIREYISGKGGPVSIKELSDEFVNKKGWKRFTLEFNLSNSDEIIPYSHGYYTMLSRYKLLPERHLAFISSKIIPILTENSVVHIQTFFEQNKMYFKSDGIDTEYVLYYLLKKEGIPGGEFPRFPYIVSENFSGESLAARHLVEEFIREKGRIVAREEPLNWLKEWLGKENRILDLALIHSNDIMYYSRGRYGEYVHRDTIDMDEANENYIHDIVSKRYNEVKSGYGRDYVLLEELYQPDQLPILPNHIPWSMELLGDILKKSDRWVMVGSYDKIVVKRGELITNEVDLVDYILRHQFNGAIKLTKMEQYLNNIHYSKDGSLLKDVLDAIEKNIAPFIIEGDELIHNQLNGGMRNE